jgi:hypothetical protein
MWRAVVWAVGGFHEVGPVFWCIHDRGFTAGWRRVQKVHWVFGRLADGAE